MASHYDIPDKCDDADYKLIRYRDLVPDDHPVRYIDRFLSGVDVSSFETRYKVGPGQTGRAPKGIRMMLGVILYGLYDRKYSSRRIDYATEHYSDFWFFTHGQRISHDKISEFIDLHEADIHRVFLRTIALAQQNNLLNFEGLYQDGFYMRANASKKRSYNLEGLNKREKKLSGALEAVLKQLQSNEEDETLRETRTRVEKDLAKISSLKEQLNTKIQKRTQDMLPSKAASKAEKLTINSTDNDSDLMRQKDESVVNSYLKVCALDAKADIVVGSKTSGHHDEAHMALGLFKGVQDNLQGMGIYDKVIADAGFTTLENCEAFEKENVQLIGPTRAYEHQVRAPEIEKPAATFTYDETNHIVHCSTGTVLHEEEKYHDKYRKTTIYVFSNREACQRCPLLAKCTDSKQGYRRVRIDQRLPAQQRTVEQYQSTEGKRLYKKRSHTAETYQGDLKQNGKFIQLFRRGLRKVMVDSILQDIVWNLRRIFNATQGEIAWNV